VGSWVLTIVELVAHICALILTSVLWAGFIPVQTQEDADQASFFSGVVAEITAEKVTVSRVILGKDPEKRTFTINTDTKIEGKLKNKSRVTVRFAGEAAVSIVVRDKADKKKQ
jgi:hypothetical protein